MREGNLKLKMSTKDTDDLLVRSNQLDILRISDHPSKWERRSWVFEFNGVTFFITTFAPFYPDSNSRYSFKSPDCYILFQPELSFALHDLPNDTAHTNWDRPVTVRDKIRVAFRDAGRAYEPPMKVNEPMVYEIVKRVHPQDEIFKWWNSLRTDL